MKRTKFCRGKHFMLFEHRTKITAIKELTLVELADLIDLSPQYLCRLFKECLSLRPFEYLARKRILKYLLKYGINSIDIIYVKHFSLLKLDMLENFNCFPALKGYPVGFPYITNRRILMRAQKAGDKMRPPALYHTHDHQI